MIRYAQVELLEHVLRAIDGGTHIPPVGDSCWRLYSVDDADSPGSAFPDLTDWMVTFDADPLRER